jgi:hypothetical protein
MTGMAVECVDEYESHFSFALEEFCSSAMPCSYNYAGEYCVNVRTRHKKGHQNSKGSIIGSGDYISPGFKYRRYRAKFFRCIKREINMLESKLQGNLTQAPEGGTSYDAQLWRLHERTISLFFEDYEIRERVVSHYACFSCLMASPEHALPCAHSLCAECALAFGELEDDTTLTLKRCPFHPHDRTWPTPWRIRLKPEFAGVRILSLDGYVSKRLGKAKLTK